MMLSRFIETFIGYGSFDAGTWFLGPEEGGGKDAAELNRRLTVWETLGSRQVVDMGEFHQRLFAGRENAPRYFDPQKPTIQRTWGRLARVVLGATETSPTTDAVGKYQATRLGRADGDTLLGELLPLPKASMRTWPYADLADEIPYLSDARSYRRAVLPQRIALLQSAIAEYRPQRVIFYGRGKRMRVAWQEIANIKLCRTEDGYYHGRNRHTAFLLMAHPNARGLTNDYFSAAGSRTSF